MRSPDHQQNESGRGQQEQANSTARFRTSNPRHLRALVALLRRTMPREHLDREAGCSNSPELVAELRRRGLDVPCIRVPDFDRDGMPIRRGIYCLTEADKRKVRKFFSELNK